MKLVLATLLVFVVSIAHAEEIDVLIHDFWTRMETRFPGVVATHAREKLVERNQSIERMTDERKCEIALPDIDANRNLDLLGGAVFVKKFHQQIPVFDTVVRRRTSGRPS